MEHSPRDVTEALFAKDEASQLLGMTVVEVAEGHAVVTMTIGPEMVNGLGVCHGGFIFSLADSAMGSQATPVTAMPWLQTPKSTGFALVSWVQR